MQADTIPASVRASYGLGDAHVEVLTGGRTNDTLRVRRGDRDLVLQHLRNDGRFDLVALMENLVRITSHLEWSRRLHGGAAWYPALVPTAQGKPCVIEDDGSVWRALEFRPGEIARGNQTRAAIASAARLYGRFAAETNDLGGPALEVSLAGFHELDSELDAFSASLDAAPAELGRELAPDRRHLERTFDLIDARGRSDGLDELVQRVVHNDTKLSNVLLDAKREAVAVLDLDLAMMGPIWHDVGDLVRSACWHDGGADEPRFSSDLFATVVDAYCAGATPTLSAAEISTFAVAGPRLALELGVRYLHDHLRAEPVLRVGGERGHLSRGRANVQLATEMIAAYDALRPIADSYADRVG